MSFEKISLKGRALRYLAMREHSRAELERKLAPHEEVPGELAQALDELQARGFIDEQRVIESLLYRRASRLGRGVCARSCRPRACRARRCSRHWLGCATPSWRGPGACGASALTACRPRPPNGPGKPVF